jgi:hypothetical protein
VAGELGVAESTLRAESVRDRVFVAVLRLSLSSLHRLYARYLQLVSAISLMPSRSWKFGSDSMSKSFDCIKVKVFFAGRGVAGARRGGS